MPTGVIAKKGPITVEDAITAKAAILSGKVPAQYVTMWMQQRLSLLSELIERYAGEKVRISVVENREQIAWTKTDPDGKHHIYLAANNLMRYVLQWDENTERLGQDITAFSTMLTAVTYHEMGHVIYTPELPDELPEVVLTFDRLLDSLAEYLSNMTGADLGELYYCMILAFARPPRFNQALAAEFQGLRYAASVRVGELLDPWAENELGSLPTIPVKDIDRLLAKAAKEFTASGKTVFTGPCDSEHRDTKADNGASVITYLVNTTMPERITKGRVYAAPSDQYILQAETTWIAKYRKNPDIKTYLGKITKDVVAAKGRLIFDVIGQNLSARLWKNTENVLEDQRLETQLSQRFGGMAKRFEYVITKQMDANNRYPLTAGRVYLPTKFLEEDRQAFEARAKSNDEAVPAGGLVKWFSRLGMEYVGLNAGEDINRMAQIQVLYCILRVLMVGNVPLGDTGALDLELDTGDLNSAKSKKRTAEQKQTEQEMADKAKDKAKKAMTVEQAMQDDPTKRARLEAAAVLSSFRKNLVGIAADQRLVDDRVMKADAVKREAAEVQKRREERLRRAQGKE